MTPFPSVASDSCGIGLLRPKVAHARAGGNATVGGMQRSAYEEKVTTVAMADEFVRRVRESINTYDVPGTPTVAGDGIAGWSAMCALTRILRHELDTSCLSDNFGPAWNAVTSARWPSRAWPGRRSGGSSTSMIRRTCRSWCEPAVRWIVKARALGATC